jgi:hypothetical protein
MFELASAQIAVQTCVYRKNIIPADNKGELHA